MKFEAKESRKQGASHVLAVGQTCRSSFKSLQNAGTYKKTRNKKRQEGTRRVNMSKKSVEKKELFLKKFLTINMKFMTEEGRENETSWLILMGHMYRSSYRELRLIRRYKKMYRRPRRVVQRRVKMFSRKRGSFSRNFSRKIWSSRPKKVASKARCVY